MKSAARITTNWVVITGAPSSGKTSVIDGLAELGFVTHPDITRLYIEEEQNRGRTLEEIRADEVKFRQDTFERMRDSLLPLNPAQLIVHDGSVPDCIAYRRVWGVPIGADVASAARAYEFRRVLLFDPPESFMLDGVRLHREEELQSQITEALEDAYSSLGYSVERVPPVPIAERLALVRALIQQSTARAGAV